mmetsp:Transcript_97766/g.276692  ORF Transcript_97766/g.276692 Transcript_97766/m.276692 type:complete len:211 (+) Transcript_97766:189-821(+)
MVDVLPLHLALAVIHKDCRAGPREQPRSEDALATALHVLRFPLLLHVEAPLRTVHQDHVPLDRPHLSWQRGVELFQHGLIVDLVHGLVEPAGVVPQDDPLEHLLVVFRQPRLVVLNEEGLPSLVHLKPEVGIIAGPKDEEIGTAELLADLAEHLALQLLLLMGRHAAALPWLSSDHAEPRSAQRQKEGGSEEGSRLHARASAAVADKVGT